MGNYAEAYRQMVSGGRDEADAADFVDYCVAEDIKARKVVAKPSYVWYRAVAANGRTVAVNVSGNQVRVWDLASNGPAADRQIMTVAEAQQNIRTVRPLIEVVGIEGKWSRWFS